MNEQTAPTEYMNLIFISDGSQVFTIRAYPMCEIARDVVSMANYVLGFVLQGWAIDHCESNAGVVRYTLSRPFVYPQPFLEITHQIMFEMCQQQPRKEG